MPKVIVDQFSALPVSRQKKYQLRCAAAGRCRQCQDRKDPEDKLCPACLEIQKHRMRQRRDPILSLI